MAYEFVDGEVLSAEKINQYLNHTALEPVSYLPDVAGIGCARTVSYLKIGRLVHVEFHLLVTSTVSPTTITMTTPTAMAGESATALGVALAVDGGASPTRRSLTVHRAGATSVFFTVDSLASAATVTSTTPWSWAPTDTIAGRFSYWEA